MADHEKRLREEPRFTLNSLAEYVFATPSRRRTILRSNLIQSPAYGASMYEHARRALVPFYTDPTRPTSYLNEAAFRLRQRAGSDPTLDDDSRKPFIYSALALEAFAPVAADTRPARLIASPGSRRHADMVIAGVTVAINPDVVFVERDIRVGALKLHIGMDDKLTKEMLQVVAVVLARYLTDSGSKPKRSNCIAVDVFGGLVEGCPQGVTKRWTNVQYSCEDIAMQWERRYEEELAKINDKSWKA